MPLFLVTTFILCFVSAGHAPSPYHLPIVISGSERITSQLSDKLVAATDKDALSITTTTSAAEAKDAVATREAAGAVVISSTGVTTYYATGAGAFQASIIKSVGAQIAGELNLPSTLTDLAPTPKEDPAGTSLFFFMVICTLGSFLSIVVMTMTNPKEGVVGQIAAVVGASLLGPIIGFSIISSFTGGFDMPFRTISAVMGVGMLYSVVIGLLTVVLARLAGLGGILVGMITLIVMNFPSSGGTTAEGILPPFWQVIHNSWMGSAMIEWIRGITYFDGAQIGRWSAQLLIWGAAAVIVLVIVVVLQSRRRALRIPA
jgi:hypothetical protein